MNQEERMEEALKSRQNVFEQDVITSLNEIKVQLSQILILLHLFVQELFAWSILISGANHFGMYSLQA
jgi:hypothetical protein